MTFPSVVFRSRAVPAALRQAESAISCTPAATVTSTQARKLSSLSQSFYLRSSQSHASSCNCSGCHKSSLNGLGNCNCSSCRGYGTDTSSHANNCSCSSCLSNGASRSLFSLPTSHSRSSNILTPSPQSQSRPFSAAADENYELLVARAIEQNLEADSETSAKVVDKSGGCGTSYEITVESRAFKGKSRIQRERMVQATIMDEIKKWHAVQIRTVVKE